MFTFTSGVLSFSKESDGASTTVTSPFTRMAGFLEQTDSQKRRPFVQRDVLFFSPDGLLTGVALL
jgi:hypothetical protein